jgi:hypothetical protein
VNSIDRGSGIGSRRDAVDPCATVVGILNALPRDMRTAVVQAFALLVVSTACTPAPADSWEGREADAHEKDSAGNKKTAKGDAPAVASTGSSANARSLPDQTPTLGKQISSPRQIAQAAPFYAQAPTVRANDLHPFVVTGKDCMTCHGSSGAAPHFAYGGTIALGRNWVWGPPTSSDGNYDDNDNDNYDDSYDDNGNYEDDGYSDNSYDDDYSDYSDYDDDSYDDGDYEDGDGYGQRGRKGSPADRSYPSTYTQVRIVGADGYVFDTVTDQDGNFWFKAKEDVDVPAYTGIRYGDFVVTGSTNGIACGSCHESGAEDSPGRLWTWNGKTPKWNQ